MNLTRKIHLAFALSPVARILGYLGLLVFLMVPSLRWTLEDFFKQKWTERLHADLAVTRRSWIPEEEIQSIVQQTGANGWAEAAEFFSTIRWKQDSGRLVQVLAVTSSFPLRGQLQNPQQQAILAPLKEHEALVDEALVHLYGLESPFSLLNQNFHMREQLGTGHFGSFRLGTLAYKVIVPLATFKDHSLSRLATFTHIVYLRFDQSKDTAQAAQILKKRYQSDTHTQVLTPEEYSESLVRPLSWVLDILSLFSFVSLILWLLFVHVRLHHEFQKKLGQLLLLNIFGISRFQLTWAQGSIQLWQETKTLGLCFIISTGFSSGIYSFLNGTFQFHIPSRFTLLGLSLFALLTLAVWSHIVYAIRNLDLSQALKSISSSILYEKQPTTTARGMFWLFRGSCLLITAFILFPSHWLILANFVTWLLLGTFPLLILRPLTLWLMKTKYARGLVRLVITRLYRAWPKTLGQSLTFSFLLFQFFLVLLIQRPVTQWILGDPLSSPQFFVFDIAHQDKDDLIQFIHQAGAQALAPSPLIRARITHHNGQIWQKAEEVSPKTREEENNFRFRSRALNLTIRDILTTSESVVQEIAIPDSHRSSLPLSVEKQFASRLGLQLGDELELDIQGLSIKGFIWQIRKVRWNSLLPNFFVQTQSGYIDEAPQTWLLAVKTSDDNIETLQQELANKFPDVSLIDLKQARLELTRLTDIFKWTLIFSSSFQGVFFMLILSYLFYLSLLERNSEWFLFRALGAPSQWKRKWVILEFSFFCIAQIITAFSLAWMFVKFLDQFLFQI